MRNGFLMIPLTLVLILNACTHMRLRTPSPEEKREYVFSKNLDRAILDPLELGPAQMVPVLSSDGEDPRSLPWTHFERQKGLLKEDIIRVGYDDMSDSGMDSMSGEEKTSSVLIGTIIVILVLAGATIPILFALDVL